jgi:cyclase
MIRANEAFLKPATAETKIASSRDSAVAGKAQVAEFRDMLATARDRLAAMVGKGMTAEAAVAAKPFADPDAKWAGNERDSVNFIRMAYNSFKRS